MRDFLLIAPRQLPPHDSAKGPSKYLHTSRRRHARQSRLNCPRRASRRPAHDHYSASNKTPTCKGCSIALLPLSFGGSRGVPYLDLRCVSYQEALVLPKVPIVYSRSTIVIIMMEKIGVTDVIPETAKMLLVDFLIGGQQQDLVAYIGEVRFDEVHSVR